MNILRKLLYLAGLLTACVAANIGAEPLADNPSKNYSPSTSATYPTGVYWGDTHLHTNLSVDAYSMGNKALGPEQAYRFARGEAVTANNGSVAQLDRPLDFLVVADHASNMGLMQSLEARSPEVLDSKLGKIFASQFDEIKRTAGVDKKKSHQLSEQLVRDSVFLGKVLGQQSQQTLWKSLAMLADQYNNPGQFTAFIGYEWSQIVYNLHRVVIFKDDANKAGEVVPFDQFDSRDPEDLWAFMSDYENQFGGEVLAIPHNGNLTSATMFALEDASGRPLSTEYAKTRSRWEPLFEVTQIKGDSETHPVLSPQDRFADYERVPVQETHDDEIEKVKKQLDLHEYDSWIQKKITNNDISWNYQYGYARPALKLGLQQQAMLGVNPFKFGMLGSTDSHTSLATADENNFWGKSSSNEPYPNRVLYSWSGFKPDPSQKGFFANAWRMNAAGYAGVWAQENTRESIFAAMKRKEVYASTGPRMKVRFFGGWDYQREDAFNPNLAKVGYEKGVPMGGDLTQAPNDKSPAFLIRAVKDPDGANLDRVQVIKGWHDANGELHEKIYDVALSDERKSNWRGKVKPVGSTVDIANASYSNSIGDPELAVVWQDPDFDKNELAFYYVRVLEIPTPRWTAYDAKFFGLKDLPKEIPMVTQERAYTSPIWYTPQG